MASRIAEMFGRLSGRNERALIAYVMAGYPDYNSSMAAVRGLVRGGADLIELGFPFTDPLADGPVIQDAATASLGAGMSMESYHSMVRDIRGYADTPVVMMTYANIAYSMGYGRFASESARAGVDGFILPDMPVEESGDYTREAHRCGADTIFLVSPNTPARRIAHIAAASTGFLYMVAVYGTTGARGGVGVHTMESLRRTKEAAGDLPVGVGFGVAGPEDVKRYAEAGADGIIVGSAILRVVGESPRDDIESRVAEFTSSLKAQTIM
ncbi:MAG: tryptophan synthase subunit alpha [Thaumarchaeota archaeon]|nr:tryptophan synthase subunit alpha [Nitrososphaerota archaeon]